MPIADVSTHPLAQLISLDGRRAVITGGARGIGLAIASRLAEAGASVVLGDADEAEAVRAAAALSDRFGGNVRGVALDVRQPASVEAVAAYAESPTGGIDIWVNNTGIYPPRAVAELSLEEWDETMAVNLRGSFLGAQAALRRMTNGARVVSPVILSVVSVSGLRGRPGLAHYCASKHGLAGFIKSLALEVGPLGVRVIGLAPTIVATPGLARSRSASAGLGHDALEGFLGEAARSLPLGRVSQPDDIARVALACVSDLGLYMTGCIVPVDGGATA